MTIYYYDEDYNEKTARTDKITGGTYDGKPTFSFYDMGAAPFAKYIIVYVDKVIEILQ